MNQFKHRYSNHELLRALIVSSVGATLCLGATLARAQETPEDVGAASATEPPVDTGAEDASGSAEKMPERRFGIFANPLGLLFGVLNADVDYLVAPRVTLTAGGSYLNWGIVSGYGLSVGPQFFLTEDGYKGLFISPKVGFSAASISTYDVTGSATLGELEATVGYQWQFKDGFSIRLGGGLAYYAALARANGADPSRYSGVRPVLSGDLGWTF